MAPKGPRPLPGEVQNALATAADAAEKRSAEGKTLFMPLATYLDSSSRSEELAELPQFQRRAIENLCDELQRVATRHFEAYIRGSPRPLPPYNRPAEAGPSFPPF